MKPLRISIVACTFLTALGGCGEAPPLVVDYTRQPNLIGLWMMTYHHLSDDSGRSPADSVAFVNFIRGGGISRPSGPEANVAPNGSGAVVHRTGLASYRGCQLDVDSGWYVGHGAYYLTNLSCDVRRTSESDASLDLQVYFGTDPHQQQDTWRVEGKDGPGNTWGAYSHRFWQTDWIWRKCDSTAACLESLQGDRR